MVLCFYLVARFPLCPVVVGLKFFSMGLLELRSHEATSPIISWVLDWKSFWNSCPAMTDKVLPRLLDLLSMRCLPLGSCRSIYVRIPTAPFAKRNLSWGLKRGKCRVAIYITRTALSHGWFSTILARFAGTNQPCRTWPATTFEVRALEVEAAVIITAAATAMVEPGGGTKGGGTHGHFCGHFDPLAGATVMELLGAAQPLSMKRTALVLDGHLTKAF